MQPLCVLIRLTNEIQCSPHLRYPLWRQPGLVVENTPKVISVWKYVGLSGQVGSSRIHWRGWEHQHILRTHLLILTSPPSGYITDSVSPAACSPQPRPSGMSHVYILPKLLWGFFPQGSWREDSADQIAEFSKWLWKFNMFILWRRWNTALPFMRRHVQMYITTFHFGANGDF